MKIAFLGLGAMGSRMARNILDAGHDLTVWNRSPGKADDLIRKGATEAQTPREAARGAAIVVSMVLDDDASRALWADEETGALGGMDRQAVAVECSTISVAWCRELAAVARERGIDLIDAPVAGTLPPAESGELVIIVGGDPDAARRAQPAFDAMGKATHHAGDNGAATTVKLVINGMLAAQEAQMAELLGMAERLGVDRRRAFDIFCQTPVASPMMQTYGTQMLEGTDAVNFPVSGILKDLGIIDQTAAQAGAEVPVARATQQSFRNADAAGLGGRNQTDILRLYELPPRS
ncbi:3-hydroxyisobutyrate dehydrogenase [Tranquillimonas rosea]|uniref:3-hydroxyisobutyrate dehydrogenase n=1 Tax=Tranquillimonas rosea TaxID=641238 RepID=A0A1H9UJH6_9RHOB|nr:NAD(P)-dependent oxidoreductase [Tranquillimonas rosea]SES09680.1 3-hydroxyisobutyrate dehydrogenase [Tranquillimonas rosea]